jgi:hypothetical protein
VPPDTTAAIFWLKTRGDAAMPAKPNWSLNKNPR